MRQILAMSAALVAALGGVCLADDDPAPTRSGAYDDGYCDYVQGVASAQSAIQLAPALFGQFGYIEQAVTSSVPSSTNGDLRLIAGVRYKLSGIIEGFATRDHATADCRRHNALNLVRGGTEYAALAARVKVLDEAMPEAQKITEQTEEDYKARRITGPEYTATKLRLEELRQLAVESHRQMSALPPATGDLGGALKTFQRADADVEQLEGKLRFMQAIDFSARAGIDAFLNEPANTTTNATPYFAVLSLDVNVGALFLGSANDRAAAGRKKLVRSGRDPLAIDATADRLEAIVADEVKRAAETEALEADLQRQLDTLAKVGGDDSKRFRLTIWFDYIKVKSEHAYLKTHIDAIHRVLGGE